MSVVQLIVQNVDTPSISNWPMVVCNQDKEQISEEFYFDKLAQDGLGNPYLPVILEGDDSQKHEEAKALIKLLCRSKKVQLVIGAYTYSCNKAEADKLLRYLELRARFSEINSGMVLYREKVEVPRWRTAELVII